MTQGRDPGAPSSGAEDQVALFPFRDPTVVLTALAYAADGQDWDAVSALAAEFDKSCRFAAKDGLLTEQICASLGRQCEHLISAAIASRNEAAKDLEKFRSRAQALNAYSLAGSDR